MKKIKALSLIAVLPLLLGNEGQTGCQQTSMDVASESESLLEVSSIESQRANPNKMNGRRLKKLIEVGFLDSQPMNLANGENFDFGFVANAQLYDLLLRSDRFVLPARSEVARPSALSPSDLQLAMVDIGHTYVRPTSAQLDASCLLDAPQIVFSGDVQSFQLLSRNGLNFGFGPIGKIGLSIPSASFSFGSAQLDLSIHAMDRLDQIIVASAQGTAKQTSSSVDLTINFGLFSFGPRHYFESPLAGVTRTALSSAIQKVATQLDQEEWFARVVEDRDTHIIIDSGSRAGLAVGDELEVFNETHRWKGEPCRSKYDRTIPESLSPVAVGRVVRVTPMAAILEVTEQGFQNPAVGARVVVRQLKSL